LYEGIPAWQDDDSSFSISTLTTNGRSMITL
jgi:hypothetical protein